MFDNCVRLAKQQQSESQSDNQPDAMHRDSSVRATEAAACEQQRQQRENNRGSSVSRPTETAA